MAMSVTTMSSEIVTELENEMGPSDDSVQTKKFADAVARAIITRLTADVEVEVTGVESGAATASGTIS